jgi:hypothetical protein
MRVARGRARGAACSAVRRVAGIATWSLACALPYVHCIFGSGSDHDAAFTVRPGKHP